IRLAREVVARAVLVLVPGPPGIGRLERLQDRVARDPARRDERSVDVEEDEPVAVRGLITHQRASYSNRAACQSRISVIAVRQELQSGPAGSRRTVGGTPCSFRRLPYCAATPSRP